jgi:LAGLIDADG DNA endonuclease family
MTTKPSSDFTALCVLEFKQKNPNLDVTKLTPTFPTQLANVDLSKKEMANTGIHPVTLSVICGTTFGDANLAKQTGYQNARLQYRHSTRQTDWFMWKTLCPLRTYVNETSIQFQQPDGMQRKVEAIGGETLGKWKVATFAEPGLTKVQQIVSPQNKKTISRRWLNHMSDYFLMTLWLDDGSLSKGRQGYISCNSTPLPQARILAHYISKVWGAECRAYTNMSKASASNPSPSEIAFVDVDNLQKFLRIVAPLVPIQSMLYKVCFFPDDRAIRQRWISELKQLVRSDFHFEIEKYYAYLEALEDQQATYNQNQVKKKKSTSPP